MNKTRSHMHMFLKKLTHHCFKSSTFICSNWIDSMNFPHFWSSKIRVIPTIIVSSLFPPRCRLSSGWRCHATHHVTLPSYWAKTSSLFPLHIPVMLYFIASPLKSKLKHWIHTTAPAILPGLSDSHPPLL
jgi:hypothetical protein